MKLSNKITKLIFTFGACIFLAAAADSAEIVKSAGIKLYWDTSAIEKYDMMDIDLIGMKLKSDKNVFEYKIKVLENIKEIEDFLTSKLASNQEIVSRVFDLDYEQDSNSDLNNIYVFVAEDSSSEKIKYVMYIVSVDFEEAVTTYDIAEVTATTLKLVNGPTREQERLTLTTGRALLGADSVRY